MSAEGSADTVVLNKDRKSERIASLDALCGFDMLWIVGGSALAGNAAKYFEWPWLKWFAGQFHHPSWEGFTCYDQIFPMFLFIVGVAIPFSIGSMRKKELSNLRIYFRITRRFILLLILGVIYNGGLQLSGYENTRFGSVLGFIGVGYFFAALIVLNCRISTQIIWFFGILLGYWAAIEWIPVPGIGAGVITPQGSLATYIDQAWMPGRFHFDLYDPQGILPCISCICTALAGAITGYWLKGTDRNKWVKAAGLLFGGIACVAIGIFWGQFLPIIKNLWTGSFVMLTAGISLLLLSIFYFIMDVLSLKKWAFFFTVIGVNPITIYLGQRFINFHHTKNFMFKGLISQFDSSLHGLLHSVFFIVTWWLVLLYFYRKKIFLKI
ncbi:MAG: DUF5009 domain-containing protein [Anaerohalosphaera sp.]|nr:DUF5009 domain-containing protein [Anaerohalosphaera sp.]